MASDPGGNSSTLRPLQFCEFVLRRVQEGDEAASTLLYERISVGLRAFLYRKVPAGFVEDCLHNVFSITLKALREGKMREPQRLPGFILTVARRQAAQVIEKLRRERESTIPLDEVTVRDDRDDPERALAAAQRIEQFRAALNGLESQHYEILTRYYLLGQSTEWICKDLRLSETQLRLTKSRAKAKLIDALAKKHGSAKAPLRRVGAGC